MGIVLILKSKEAAPKEHIPEIPQKSSLVQ